MTRVIATTSNSAIAMPRVDPRLLVSLVAVYIIWGSTYLAMRVAVHELPPLLMASMRFLAAGTLLLWIAVRRGATVPPPRDWLRVAPIGACLFLGGNGFVAMAETTIPSGGAAVVCATMPLWAGVLGRVLGEPVTVREWMSLVIGFVGVIVLMGGPTLGSDTAHVVLLIGSPIMWAIGSLLARRTRDVGGDHATLVGPALQMLTGGAILIVVSALRGEAMPAHASIEAWLALAYLFVFGSVVGFTAYAWLLHHARPVVATSYAYVNPIIAVLLGAALDGEALGWRTLVANALIVGAVMLALRRGSANPKH
jgi:drug/metabolite transporter (DMT)-like permease